MGFARNARMPGVGCGPKRDRYTASERRVEKHVVVRVSAVWKISSDPVSPIDDQPPHFVTTLVHDERSGAFVSAPRERQIASLRLVKVKSRALIGGTTTAKPGLPSSLALTRTGTPIASMLLSRKIGE